MKVKRNFSVKRHNQQWQKFGRYPRDKSESKKCIYGNFPTYYGYRNRHGEDNRISCMKREWIERKVVLDVGCNAGHVTLALARDFSPDVIIGIDIDPVLVETAARNVRNYLDFQEFTKDVFPISLVMTYGPFAIKTIPSKKDEAAKFPCNVMFVEGNYVLESDDLLNYQEPYFDTVVCFSVTKWVHLNWGDEGLKRLFHRMFANLKPGGHLLLEAQPWDSYLRRKKWNKAFAKIYDSIKLFPEMFNDYLLKEVGFISCELVDTPSHSEKGFCRPIYLFTKARIKKIVSSHKYFVEPCEEEEERQETTDCTEIESV